MRPGRLLEEIDHRIGIGDAAMIRGCVSARRGEAVDAVARFEESLRINRETGYLLGEAEVCRDYAEFLRRTGSEAQSRDLYRKAKEIFTDLGASEEVKRLDRLVENETVEIPKNLGRQTRERELCVA